jgi:hypothetical protein
MKKHKQFIAGTLFMTTLLVGCGGSSSDSSDDSAENKSVVSMFITDNLADDFDKVWVTVKHVGLVSDTGTEVVLYDDATGQVYNLAELAGVGELLSSTPVSPGTYTGINVALDDDVSLVDGDGNTVAAKFNNTGEDYELTVPANLVVTEDETSSLALDFDLANFEYDEDTGLVTPDVKVKDEDDVRDLDQVVARLHGEVTEVIDADSFVMRAHRRHGFALITVDLAADATFIGPEVDSFEDLFAELEGKKIHVAGNFDPSTLSLEAINLVVLSQEDDDDDRNSDGSPRRAEIVGVLTSFDGANATIDIRDANFVPPSDELPIANLANAHFVRGSLSTLEVGQTLIIRGTWDSTTFSAWLVKIEGVADEGGKMAEFKGEVVSFVDNMLTVDVLQHNEAAEDLGSPITFDATNVFLKKGRLSCLEAGAFIKVMGSVEEGVFYPTRIEFKSKCGALGRHDDDDDNDEDENEDEGENDDDNQSDDAINEDEDDDDDDEQEDGDDDRADDDHDHGDDHGGNLIGRVKIEGTVSAIEGNLITLTIIEARGLADDISSIAVDISMARFKDGNPADLATETFVEVHGLLNGDTVKAVLVELDD